MKYTPKLMLVAVMALSISLTHTVSAHEHGAKSLKGTQAPCDSKGACCSMDQARTAQIGSPRMQSLRPTMVMGHSENDPDLVRQQREIVYTGKNPIRDLQNQQLKNARSK